MPLPCATNTQLTQLARWFDFTFHLPSKRSVPHIGGGEDRVTRDMIMHEQPSGLAAAVHAQAWAVPSSRSHAAL